MAESNWNLKASEEAGMIEELRQQKVQELKEAVYEVVLRQQKAQRLKEAIAEDQYYYNYVQEHAFSADLNKARRER